MNSNQPKQPKKPFWLFDFFYSQKQYKKFKKLAQCKKSIVFYAESGQDWHHLEPLVTTLAQQHNQSVCFVSSDRYDPGLNQNNPNILGFYIREGLLQISFFQFLKAGILVLTMEDLQVFQLKRSIHPVHYLFVFHAMGSTHMVNLENSYDYYDTLFCVGPHQQKEIRKREELYSLTKKNLFNYGYSRLDSLIQEHKKFNNDIKKDRPTILVAPTWGDNSILNVCGGELIGQLLKADFKVILRPHYQTIKLTPEKVKNILEKHGSNPNLHFVNKMGDTISLFESDLLICDWSSTSIEYALGLSKPVLYIDVPRRVRNPKYESLDMEPLEVSIRSQVGAVLTPENLDQAPQVIGKLLSNPTQFKESIKELRNSLVYNIGNSASVGAKEIVRIVDSLPKEENQ